MSPAARGLGTQPPAGLLLRTKEALVWGYVYPKEVILGEPPNTLSAGEFSGLFCLLLYQLAVLGCPWRGGLEAPSETCILRCRRESDISGQTTTAQRPSGTHASGLLKSPAEFVLPS